MDINEKLNQAAQESMKAAQEQETQKAEETKQTETQVQETSEETKQVEEKINEKPVDDEAVLKYLRENRGVEIESLENIGKPVELSFASPEVEQLNIYAQETGRGLNDFLKTKKDWSEASDEDVAREHYLLQNPDATSRQFELTNDLHLKPLEPLEGDNYTPEEIRAREERIEDRNLAIEKRDALLQQKAKEARRAFAELNDKLNQPLSKNDEKQAKVTQVQEAWQQGVQEAAKEFDLGIEGYKHEATPQELTERYSSLDKVVDLFKNDKGELDVIKMMRTIEKGLSYDKINSVISENAQTKAKEEIINSMEQPNGTFKKEQLNTGDKGLEHAASQIRQLYGL